MGGTSSGLPGGSARGTAHLPVIVIDSSDDNLPNIVSAHTLTRGNASRWVDDSDSNSSLPEVAELLSGRKTRSTRGQRDDGSPTRSAREANGVLVGGRNGNAPKSPPLSRPQKRKKFGMSASGSSNKPSPRFPVRTSAEEPIDLTFLDSDCDVPPSPPPAPVEVAEPENTAESVTRPKPWLAKKTVGSGTAKRMRNSGARKSAEEIAEDTAGSEIDKRRERATAFMGNGVTATASSSPGTAANDIVMIDVDTVDERETESAAGNAMSPALESDPTGESPASAPPRRTPQKQLVHRFYKRKKVVVSSEYVVESSDDNLSAAGNTTNIPRLSVGKERNLPKVEQQPRGPQNVATASPAKPRRTPRKTPVRLGLRTRLGEDSADEGDASSDDPMALSSIARSKTRSGHLVQQLKAMTKRPYAHLQSKGQMLNDLVLPSSSIPQPEHIASQSAVIPRTPSVSPPPSLSPQRPASGWSTSQGSLARNVASFTRQASAAASAAAAASPQPHQRSTPPMLRSMRSLSGIERAQSAASVAHAVTAPIRVTHQSPFARSSPHAPRSTANGTGSDHGIKQEILASHLPSPPATSTPPAARSSTPLPKSSVFVDVPPVKGTNLNNFLGGLTLAEWRQKRIAEKLKGLRGVRKHIQIRAERRAAILREERIIEETVNTTASKGSWAGSTEPRELGYTPSTTNFGETPAGPSARFDYSLQDRVNAIPESERSWHLLKTVFESYISESTCVDEPDAPDITIVNDVDAEPRPPPFEFQYSNNMLYDPDMDPPVPSAGCGCIGPCDPESKTCLCARRQSLYFYGTASGFCYTQDKLRPIDDMSIWECSDACGCPPTCSNRVIQRGRSSATELQLFKTVDKGWGVRNGGNTVILPGTFVGIYSGELLSEEESEHRAHAYNSVGRTYLFDLDGYQVANPPKGLEQVDPQLFKLAREAELDAKAWYRGTDMTEGYSKHSLDAFHWGLPFFRKQNIARFYNHSCNPNIVTVQAYVKDFHPNRPILALFARRKIMPNEELCISYHGVDDDDGEEEPTTTNKQGKGRSQHVHVAPPKAGRSRAADAERTLSIKDECRCGSRKCAGYLFSVNK